MNPQVANLKDLPTPMKIGLLVASGAGISALIIFVPAKVRVIVLVGIVAVVLILLLYWRTLKWLQKRKAAPMERGVIENTSAAPQGISEAAKMARLDDLRKKFEDGVQKFRAAGKSLYNFPWYMIVGEPGSGKTEAIRHCNVGFPPGLQDQFQGAGGTLNMNWWFTDHAVILDTAGRLMFEQVESGGSGEWREFLKLLKKCRPQCPINGVFLVIPADSLIKDTADEIEQKASKIARQFDAVQRTLDVRFPVFVIVTKSDLINGFRDFFDGLDDPQLQHQILGWSNPEPLDEPYNPEFIEQHLRMIQARLFRRRLGLIQEILSEEHPGAEKRAVDTLYAFPQGITRIASRMTRYLELIFSVGSKWSCKPLFFRGIYFTSSMREGSALDEDLAESLGVPVESLPEGRVWERDRAYFLRDLFMKKVFREKGLVTDATNATKQHVRRRALVMVSAIVSVVFLLLFTFYAYTRFNKSIGELKVFLTSPALASGKLDENLQVIKKENDTYRYIGRASVNGMPDDIKRYNVSAQLLDVVGRWEKKGVPWIFRLAAGFSRRITSDELKKAEAVIYENGVLQPFINAAADGISAKKNGQWTRDDAATKVLHHLIWIKAGGNLQDQGDLSAQTFLDPLSDYVLPRSQGDESTEDFQKRLKMYNDDKVKLHEPFTSIYGKTWSTVGLKNDPNWLNLAIGQGVKLFNEYWTDETRLAEHSKDYASVEAIKKLTAALEKFDAAEQRLLGLAGAFNLNSDKSYVAAHWKDFAEKWRESFAAINEAVESVRACGASIKMSASLEGAWAAAAATVLRDVNDNYQFLLKPCGQTDKQAFLGTVRDSLEQAYAQLTARLRQGDFEEKLKLLNKNFYLQLPNAVRLFQARFDLYAKANEQVTALTPVSGIQQVPQAFKESFKAAADARRRIEELLSLDRAAFRVSPAADLSRWTVDSAERRHCYDIVKAGLDAAPKTANDIQNLIDRQASWNWSCVPKEAKKKFDPVAAAAVLSGWKVLGTALADASYALPKDMQQMHRDANGVYNEYAKLYLDYWLDEVPHLLVGSVIPHENTWKAQHKQLEKLVVWDVLARVNELGKCIDQALNGFEEFVPADYTKLRQFRANKDNLTNKFFQAKCTQWVEKWIALSDDPFEARNTLLIAKPVQLVKDYFSFSSAAPAEFADLYWSVLAEDSLRILVDEVQAEQVRALDKLRTQYGGKFPLARDSTVDLTVPEFVDAYALVAKSGPQESLDPTTVGGGASTAYPRLDSLFMKLRSPTTADKWIETIKHLFRALPRPGDSYYCRITLLDEKQQYHLEGGQGDALLLNHLNEFRLVQAGQKGQRLRTRAQKNTLLDTVKYPGPQTRFEFYQYPSDPDDKPAATLEFTEPWSCLRMFCSLADPEKGKGYIKINVKPSQGRGGLLYLQLEFCRESGGACDIDLPKLADWPLMRR